MPLLEPVPSTFRFVAPFSPRNWPPISPLLTTTLKTLWSRLSDAYFFDALRDPAAAPETPADHAKRFLERLGSAAKPRIPALALGDELEITGEGLVGAALLYDGRICHLAAFGDG